MVSTIPVFSSRLPSLKAAAVVCIGIAASGAFAETATGDEIEPLSGIAKADLARIVSFDFEGETLFGVYFRVRRPDPAQLQAAPARLCASRGLKVKSVGEQRSNDPELRRPATTMTVVCN